MAADQAAVDAMRTALNDLDIDGVIVIGEGERDEAPMLYIGEKVGKGGPAIDIALDPLEGTSLTAKAMANALAVMAWAPTGTMLHAPDTYMDKIACGPGYPEGMLDLDASAADNARAMAAAKGVAITEITACVLDRPRHTPRSSPPCARPACARHLITDGDVAGVMNTADPETGIDFYIGQGGAPEGVLACAALKCVGGQFQGRLVFRNADERARASEPRHHRSRQEVRPARDGARRRDLRRDRCHRRRAAAGREVQGRLRPHPHPGDELGQPHGARSQDETPAVTTTSSIATRPFSASNAR